MQERQYHREAAHKASVAEILGGEFVVVEDGTTALSIAGRHIKRANIVATVVDKSSTENTYKSLVVDDGSGQIKLRFFDDALKLYEKTDVGDFALIIGKPRHYGEEMYIAPELIRKLEDVKWAEVRKIELKALQMHQITGAAKTWKEAHKQQPNDADIVSKDKVWIYKTIKELDAGRGADITEVVIKSGTSGAEALIKEMISAGDLFEVSPGMLKVLE